MLTLLRYDYLILSPGAQQHKQREALSVIVDVALQITGLGQPGERVENSAANG
jgi:hypothetical protein